MKNPKLNSNKNVFACNWTGGMRPRFIPMNVLLLIVVYVVLWVWGVSAKAEENKHERKRDVLFTVSQFTFAGATGMDWYSGVRLDKSKYTELNPVLGKSRVSQAAIMGGMGIGVELLARWGHRKGLRRFGSAVLLLGSIPHVYGAAHNWRLR